MQTDGFAQAVGPEVVTFDPTDTDLLLSVGWDAPAAGIADDFDDHASRLRTLVAIATALGFGPEVGAMQANCGTPQEHGLGALVVQRASLVAAQADEAAALDALTHHRTDAEAVLVAVRENAAILPEPDSADDTIAALEAELTTTSGRIAALETALAARQTEIDALEATIAAGIAEALPGTDPQAAWQFANLDVTGDGVVDADDLLAALEQAPDAAQPGATE